MSAASSDSGHIPASILAILICPACDTAYCLGIADATPRVLSCGHTVCEGCATVIGNLDAPICTICKQAVAAESVANGGLELLLSAQTAGDEVASTAAAAAASDAMTAPTCAHHPSNAITHICPLHDELLCGVCLSTAHGLCAPLCCDTDATPCTEWLQSRIAAWKPQFEAGIASCLRTVASLERLKQRMASRLESSITALDPARVSAAVEADARKELKKRIKSIDVQMGTAEVSAGQLACAVKMCDAAPRNAVHDPQLAALLRTAVSAKKMGVLLQPYRGPSSSTLVEVVCDSTSCEPARMRSGLDAAQSFVVGGRWTPLTYVVGVENTVELRLRDVAGAHITDSIGEEDVFAWLESTESSNPGAVQGGITTITRDEDGTFHIGYRIDAAECRNVRLGCNVAGTVGIAGAPWLLTQQVRLKPVDTEWRDAC